MIEQKPSVKITFFPDIEETGAKKGFINIKKNVNNKPEAKYNNCGRFIFMNDEIAVGANSGRIGFKEFRDNPESFAQNLKVTKFGIFGMLSVKDFDHGHEATLFFSADSKDPRTKLTWFADAVTREIKNVGLTQDNMSQHVFEIGKEKAKQGTGGKFYIKYVGTVEDIEMIQDPTGSERRKKILLENQTPPPESNIQNFILNDQETWLMGQINELVAAKNIVVNTDRLKSTFLTGFGGKKTTPERAAYIATHASELGYKGKIE